MNCYVCWNGGAWFVKEASFFEAQKPKNPGDGWWKHWRPLYGVDGIEHARDRAKLIWGEHGERWTRPEL